MTEPNDEKEEKQWVPATPFDAIQDPPLRCRVKEDRVRSDWKESTLVGWDRSDKYQWACSDPMIQWAEVCEVWKPAKSVETIVNDWLYHDGDVEDSHLVARGKELFELWAKERDSGLDVVASSYLDQLRELVSALDAI